MLVGAGGDASMDEGCSVRPSRGERPSRCDRLAFPALVFPAFCFPAVGVATEGASAGALPGTSPLVGAVEAAGAGVADAAS